MPTIDFKNHYYNEITHAIFEPMDRSLHAVDLLHNLDLTCDDYNGLELQLKTD